MVNYYDKFVAKLQEIFMMDHAELDFGIYRIMNQKRDEINRFLQVDLLPQVKSALQGSGANTQQAKQRMAEIEQMFAGMDIETLPASNPHVAEYKKLKAQLAQGGAADDMEGEVFSHLVTFFSRYYDGGDFLSKRRYKDNTYAIPYNGEEVKLHWANSDQYYIKTSEYFRDYTFVLPTSRRKVHFVLKDASTEQNNNRAANNMERRFALYKPENEGELVVEVTEEGELNINFTYELMPKATKQDALRTEAFEAIKPLIPEGFEELLTVKAPTNKEPNRTLLEKHLTDYTAKNSFDYFIHKDLGGFLSRELDFYIKNEVLHIDDLDPQHISSQLSIVKAIKQVGQKIIQMLAQLENFQKKLWLKKKFVVQSDYCITLDRVPEKLYPQIIANDAQRKEWVRLFAINDIKGDLTTEAYSEPLTIEFLKQNPFLVLDTAFFDAKFKHKLIASMENVDEQTNGLLIRSDNFQALHFLRNKYSKGISAIYIDPPYNTGNDGFVYKDGYSHSSWLTMFHNRLESTQALQKTNIPFFASLNSKEIANLVASLSVFDTWFSIKVRHEERLLRKDIKYQDVIEYLIQLNSDFVPSRIFTDNNDVDEYIYSVEINEEPDEILYIGGYEIEKYSQNKVTLSRHTTPSESLLKRYTIRGSLITQSGSASEFYEVNLRSRRDIDGRGCLYKVIGMGARGDGLGYRMIMQPGVNGGDNGIYFQGWPLNYVDKGLPHPNFFDYVKEFNDCSNQGGIKFPNGKKPIEFLDKVFQIANLDQNAIVLDYFAGSGTTGHSVIEHNKKNSKDQWKYILVEFGTYFDEKTKRRIQNVTYSSDWRDGKPVSRNGISQCFKYIRLEQYEDTLNNLEIKKQELNFQPDEFRESYMLSYLLDTETRDSLLNLQWFENPFEMTLKTTRDNELVETQVDMVETFNYLIGLNVETEDWYQDDNICVVQGRTHRDGLKTLVIWRNCKVVDNNQLCMFFDKMDFRTRDTEFDVIYVNGDNTLPNLRRDEEHWKVVLTEEEFQKHMFEEA